MRRDASWYQVTATSKVDSYHGGNIGVEVTWSDRKTTSFELLILAERSSESSKQSGVYTTNVAIYTTNSDEAVTVSDNKLTIKSSKLTSSNTTVSVYANSKIVTSFVCRQAV